MKNGVKNIKYPPFHTFKRVIILLEITSKASSNDEDRINI